MIHDKRCYSVNGEEYTIGSLDKARISTNGYPLATVVNHVGGTAAELAERIVLCLVACEDKTNEQLAAEIEAR